MQVNDVINLENNKSYLLLLESILENKKYFLAVEVDENEEPLSEYVIYEHIIENGEEYVEKVINPILLNQLLEDYSLQNEDLTENNE